MPRNPNAPAPAMIGASTVEKPGSIEVRADYSKLGEMIRSYFGIMMMGAAQVE